MDTGALKIILKLQEENTLLNRAAIEAAIMLKTRKQHLVLEYGLPGVSFLFSEIKDILSVFQEKKQPTNNAD